MNHPQRVITEPAIQREPIEYSPEPVQEPQYIADSIYYLLVSSEASDEEFFLASISGDNYKSWLEEEDIIDHSKRKPL